MGFWDAVGKIAGSALNEAKAAGERSKQYKEEMLGKSDYELASIVKRERGNSPLKAGAAFQELKNQGYDQERINDMVRNA